MLGLCCDNSLCSVFRHHVKDDALNFHVTLNNLVAVRLVRSIYFVVGIVIYLIIELFPGYTET